jgi:hypothetical protein
MPNFIVHFKRSVETFAEDGRMTYAHVAIYLSLFYLWNSKKFIDNMSINRDDIMYYACVCSKKLYYRVVNDLHAWGYITYEPSHNPRRGSRFTVHDPENAVCRTPNGTTTAPTTDTTVAPQRPPSINNTNVVNGINETRGERPTPAPDEKERLVSIRHSRPVDLKEAVDYFREQKQSPLEAEKFYNYYQGSGWERRDHTPIRDWQAVARSWILKIENFKEKKTHSSKGLQPNHLATENDKDFAEPL